MKHTLTALAAFMILASAPSAQAAAYLFSATLDGPSEAPPNASLGIGHAIVLFDPVAHTMQVNVIFGGLTGLTTVSHIHCCTATPFFSGTAGIGTSLPSFPGFPANVTSGIYNSPVFDMT